MSSEVSADDLAGMYYAEELSVKEIATLLDCSEEWVRQLRNRHGLPNRDRRWSEDEIRRATEEVMPRYCGDVAGIDKDMRVMAIVMRRRTSDVTRRFTPHWIARFAPHLGSVSVIQRMLGSFEPEIAFEKLDEMAIPPRRSGLHFDLFCPRKQKVQNLIQVGLSVLLPQGYVALLLDPATGENLSPPVEPGEWRRLAVRPASTLGFGDDSKYSYVERGQPVASMFVMPAAPMRIVERTEDKERN